MIRAIFEPTHIDIFHKYKEASAISAEVAAGTFVMKTGADTVKKSDGTDVWGLLSQNVRPAPPSDTFRPYLNHQAYDGDFVGVYTDPGYFWVDQFEGSASDYTPGAEVYVNNAGVLTDTLGAVGAAAGVIAVGRVVKVEDNQILLRFYGQTGMINKTSEVGG